MTHSCPTRRSSDRGGGAMLATYASLVFIFLYLPIAVIILFAFDDKAVPGLPMSGVTLDWFGKAFSTPELVEGLLTSVRLALCRSEEHTSELQSLMRISYAVFCLKKKK